MPDLHESHRAEPHLAAPQPQEPQLAELSLRDGTTIRLELTPTGSGPAPSPQDRPGKADLPDVADPPEGAGPTLPVPRSGAGAATAAVATLRTTLRPLGPLLQEIHDVITTAERPPNELSVQFGVQVGQDLKLGIVGVNGRASLTITATWQPRPPRGCWGAAAPPPRFAARSGTRRPGGGPRCGGLRRGGGG
ncbi:CU044_2847 family protein [Streptomyces celluloflavus]